jgi:hypothetical protein
MEPSGVVCRGVEIVASSPPPQPHLAYPPEGLAVEAHATKRKGRAFLWGLSGTVLSAVGFIGLTLFEQYNHSLNELQRDLKHFNEASADLVKKESLHRCYDHLKESFKELQASNVTRTHLERELEASQRDRHELTRELQLLRERLAAVEGRQAATAVILPAVAKD